MRRSIHGGYLLINILYRYENNILTLPKGGPNLMNDDA